MTETPLQPLGGKGRTPFPRRSGPDGRDDHGRLPSSTVFTLLVCWGTVGLTEDTRDSKRWYIPGVVPCPFENKNEVRLGFRPVVSGPCPGTQVVGVWYSENSERKRFTVHSSSH